MKSRAARLSIARPKTARTSPSAPVKHIIDRFCGGRPEELVVGLVNSDVIDRRQLERLARKIAEGKIGEKSGSAARQPTGKEGRLMMSLYPCIRFGPDDRVG